MVKLYVGLAMEGLTQRTEGRRGELISGAKSVNSSV
jgi:hypothetical protein